MPPRYEIRLIRGDGGWWRDGVFDDLQVSTDDGVLLLLGRLDQSALHGVLERVRALRWQVLDVRRTRSLPEPRGEPSFGAFVTIGRGDHHG